MQVLQVFLLRRPRLLERRVRRGFRYHGGGVPRLRPGVVVRRILRRDTPAPGGWWKKKEGVSENVGTPRTVFFVFFNLEGGIKFIKWARDAAAAENRVKRLKKHIKEKEMCEELTGRFPETRRTFVDRRLRRPRAPVCSMPRCRGASSDTRFNSKAQSKFIFHKVL